MIAPPPSLEEMMADADRATVRGSYERRRWAVREIDGAWVIVATRLAGNAVLDQMADIENDAYLRGLGWDR